jgi:hypothetical protein
MEKPLKMAYLAPDEHLFCWELNSFRELITSITINKENNHEITLNFDSGCSSCGFHGEIRINGTG